MVKQMDALVKADGMFHDILTQMNDQRKEISRNQDTIIRHLNISHLTIPKKDID
jgi:hypothetical protein